MCLAFPLKCMERVGNTSPSRARPAGDSTWWSNEGGAVTRAVARAQVTCMWCCRGGRDDMCVALPDIRVRCDVVQVA